MKQPIGCLKVGGLLVIFGLNGLSVQPQQSFAIAAPTMVSACPDSRPGSNLKAYDVIVFNDQVLGIRKGA